MRISTKPKADIVAWAKSQCAAFKVLADDYRALAFESDDGEVGAAVFYDSFRGSDCNLTVLIKNRELVRRGTLRRAFEYPFVEAKCRRVSAAVNSHNLESRSLIERLGFKYEGTRRRVYENGANEIVYGMLRSECHWLVPHDRLQLNVLNVLDPHTGGAF